MYTVRLEKYYNKKKRKVRNRVQEITTYRKRQKIPKRANRNMK
jgi:hypothetical protein